MYSETNGGEKCSSTISAQSCRRVSLEEIQSSTKNFNHELVIGHGGFGTVYKGQISSIDTDHAVAIKRLDSMSNQGAPEFRAEIEMLSTLRHCHLVSLIGFCDDNKEMILLYNYMPRGTLYHHLHKADTRLTWVQRLKIAIGAARGLDYLHTGVGTQHGVIHRDVKSSNILLDENWEAMISDFGLSKIGPCNQSSSYVDASVKGTFGYIDPEYFYTRKLTRKTDVYAFGVVLFELLSGRRAVDERYGEEQCSLVKWAQKCTKERKLDQMVDSSIMGTIFPKCLKGFAQIADRCLNSCQKERPTMAEVMVSLQILLAQQEKYDNSVEPSAGIMGFVHKMHKYYVSSTKGNSDQSGTSSSKFLENNMKHNSLAGENGSRDRDIMPHQSEEIVASDLKLFTFDELKRIVKGFRDHRRLINDLYVNVYKGWVDKMTYSPCKRYTGLHVAVYKLRRYKHFDLKTLKEFRHPNLVKLIGYCMEAKQLFLVYEYVHSRNFKDLLHNGAVSHFPLVTKVKIAVGIARGIVFLHQTQLDETQHEAYPQIWTGPVSDSQLYRDRILLDEDFTAKLSDYDVAKLVDGYYTSVSNDPNYQTTPFLPHQLRNDLSGFRVVFAEILTGKEISTEDEFWEINGLLREHGEFSLLYFATMCFETCNEVNSESKMLTILEEYDKVIQRKLKTSLLDPEPEFLSCQEEKRKENKRNERK